jgi:hypothetical protein
MDYTRVLNEIKEASLFDLFRFKAAIGLLMDDPKRLEAIKRNLRVNESVAYFDTKANSLIPATILEIRRTNVLISNHHDGKQWVIPLYMLNLDCVDTDIHKSDNSQKGLDKTQIKIGEVVGFIDKGGVEQYGQVIRMNQKTVSLLVGDNHKWRVSYTLLFPVIDGKQTYKDVSPSAKLLLDQ